MARHRLQRNVERRGELRDEQVFFIQSVEDFSPYRIGESAEHQIQGLVAGFRLIHAQSIMNLADDNQQLN